MLENLKNGCKALYFAEYVQKYDGKCLQNMYVYKICMGICMENVYSDEGPTCRKQKVSCRFFCVLLFCILEKYFVLCYVVFDIFGGYLVSVFSFSMTSLLVDVYGMTYLLC